MKILILDLKWSYGNEVLIDQLRRSLMRYSDVQVESAKRPSARSDRKVAISKRYWGNFCEFFNPLTYTRTLGRIRDYNPDVVYILSPHVLNVPMMLLCKAMTKAAVISHIHDTQYSGKFIVSTVADTVAKLQSRYSDRVYCFGGQIQREIINKFRVPSERVAAFRLGPGHRTPSDLPESDLAARPRIQFSQVGTIIHRKGVEYFLEAARLFNHEHGPDAVQFLLAGSGDIKKYQDQIEKLPNLEVRNRFLEDEEVNEILATSYAAVLAYTEGSMQSSFVAISYGNGCPVIVSDVGSLREEVKIGRTGFVVERRNARQIADAMTSIYSGRREDFVSNCVHAYHERFSWDKIGEEYYRDMENLIAARCVAGMEEGARN